MKKPMIVDGFELTGLACGIKSIKKNLDLGIIYATNPKTTIAGVFTQNKVCAAPVKWCRAQLKRGKGIGSFIVVNSGNANAATGKQGLKDTKKTATHAAKVFGVKEETVFVCSTGKIGVPLPVEKIIKGITQSESQCHREKAEGGLQNFSRAIMTTDATQKIASVKSKIGKKYFTMTAIAKGAGMIHPDMATMLCFVMTDLKIESQVLTSLLKGAVDQTLNCLTVDGDTSTNDTTLMMASAASGIDLSKRNSNTYKHALKALTNILQDIAIQIALDGEGATKCLKIKIIGARSRQDAKKVARAIGNSQLVKTAMFGSDPNWGRILCAAGYSGASLDECKTCITLGKTTVFEKGRPLNKNEKYAAVYLKSNKLIDMVIDLGLGKHSAHLFASDLTYEYVRINADYRT